MNNRLNVINEIYSEKLHRYEYYKEKNDQYIKIHETQLERMDTIDKSIDVIQLVASMLQLNVRDKIVSIVQTALDAVFPGNYFNMNFVSRRDKTEVDMYIEDKDGNEMDIDKGFGGGLRDLISFALRMALWSIGNTSPVIILDEPFKFVSENYKVDSANLIKTISDNLHLQFIVVSHVPQIKEIGDKRFNIELNKNGRSSVTTA